MAFDRAEYRQHIVEAEKQHSAEGVRNLKSHERAALEAEAVTGDPHWDYYLSCHCRQSHSCQSSTRRRRRRRHPGLRKAAQPDT